ncbi:hypothetical protein Golob_026908 [Gossypium lobatum]|uniref:Uncharacterized protein n=1 Tax=Gossypium lobatum TaxID=34289 RepID=A0A7J8LWJ8_9ROSI|nr:hypothetical protein [Gossypium lobatum]
MQMERERRNSIANGDYSCYTNDKYSRFSNDYSVSENEKNQSLPSSSLPSAGFIEHPVSRFDTLAGVAIKYGVEVTILILLLINASDPFTRAASAITLLVEWFRNARVLYLL